MCVCEREREFQKIQSLFLNNFGSLISVSFFFGLGIFKWLYLEWNFRLNFILYFSSGTEDYISGFGDVYMGINHNVYGLSNLHH